MVNFIICSLTPLVTLPHLQVHGLLHLLGFDHEISEEAEAEMDKEEGVLLESLGWKGKGLIQSAYDAETTMNHHMESSDGNFTVLIRKKLLSGFERILLLGCKLTFLFILELQCALPCKDMNT